MRYDLAIIGGGPAGYTAAERAGKAGLKTIIFEQNNLGGVCLNEGCIPTKTLLYSAKTYANAINAQKYGVNAGNATFDTAKIVARKGKVVRKLVLGIKARLTAAGVETVTGRAHIAGAHTIECDGQTYECDRMMLCTGSDTFVPPIDGIGDVTYWTHRDVLDCKELPRTIIIVGGGVIGMELASYLCTMGTGVTVIEMTSEILGNLDGEISAALRAEYAKRGITFMLDTRVTAVHEGGEGITVRYESGGAEGSATAEKLLMSVGRRPVTTGYGLENLGLATDSRHRIITDNHMMSSVPGIYVCGDLNGRSLLAHTSVREAEVASVGLTAAEAGARGIECREVKVPMAYSGRFVADRIVNRLGPRRVLYACGFFISGGLALAVCAPLFGGMAAMVGAMVGFALVGCGTSAVVPLCCGLAGKAPGVPPSIAIAQISTIGFFGFLAAPPFIGYVAHAASLRLSFTFMAIVGLLVLLATRRLRLAR